MNRLLTIGLIGFTLYYSSATSSRAEPSPDLMNSLSSMRYAALRKSQAKVPLGRLDLHSPFHARTRTITAGQATVDIPELKQLRRARASALGCSSDKPRPVMPI